MMAEKNIPEIPAPWNLIGNGYIILYRWGLPFLESEKLMPEVFSNGYGRHSGGFGAVMAVDYNSSDAGPYKELLFMTDKFKTPAGQRHNIEKIFVSSEESVENGIRNWAIPKELGDFSFESTGKASDRIQVGRPGADPFLDISLSRRGPSFPVNTSLMPFRLAQERDDKRFFTAFQGKGMARFARIDSMNITNKADFPDFAQKKPFLALHIRNFRITFPIPKIEGIQE